jgi:hypothetical protein
LVGLSIQEQVRAICERSNGQHHHGQREDESGGGGPEQDAAAAPAAAGSELHSEAGASHSRTDAKDKENMRMWLEGGEHAHVGAYLAAAGGGRAVGGVGMVAGLVMSPAAANAAAVMPLVESTKLGIRTGDRGMQVCILRCCCGYDLSSRLQHVVARTKFLS